MRLVVFPGQGSQFVGMGYDIYSSYSSAKYVYEEVEDAISMNLADLIFNGPEEVLTSTENAQVAIMTVCMASVRVLQNSGMQLCSGFVAGHSLGEYSALCAAGALSLSDTARLLVARGQAMKECAEKGYGMSAVIGLDIERLEDVVKQIASTEFIEIANDNSNAQIVVSGSDNALEMLAEKAIRCGALKVVRLNVSGPFHSSKMSPAVEKLADIFDTVTFNKPTCPIIANYTGKAEIDGFKELLLKQIVSMVRWREAILNAVSYGVVESMEIGAGKVLSGLIRRTTSSIKTLNVCDVEDVRNLLSKMPRE